MSVKAAVTKQDREEITCKQQLVDYLASGCKSRDEWRIGTEHEKFVYDLATLQPVPYEGPRGIRALLEGLQAQGRWTPICEGENIIGLKGDDGAAVSLEPGGQLELSGAPLENIRQTCQETGRHLTQAKAVCEKLGLGMIGLGFHPTASREDIFWMPKGRYKIMREYMPKKGNLGLDMMTRTCTVQVNLDFSSEVDMIKKMRVGLALQPIATALFASSPVNGYQSFRSHVWTDTDPDRTGDLPFVFDKDFGFERYVDYMLDVPMYFVYRNGGYVDASGQSFCDFMAGKLPALPGQRPQISDWADHLTTAFPEVRLKKYIEMRGADSGSWKIICALPAFWTGLLYDEASLDAAYDLIKDWTHEERSVLRREVPKSGLKTAFRTQTVRELARECLRISRAGLQARGLNEESFLAPIEVVAESGRSFSDQLLEFAKGHSIEEVYKALSY